MNDATRFAGVAAAVVIAVLGGLYLVGLTGPREPGGPRPTPTPVSTPEIPSLGTITLHADGCSWERNPGQLEATPTKLPATVTVRNETDTFANFGVYLLDAGFAFEDAAAWIARENDALHGGPSQPPQDFATEIVSIDAPDRNQYATTVSLDLGTYGIVCSSNEPPPGDVFAVYVVGPLEITAP